MRHDTETPIETPSPAGASPPPLLPWPWRLALLALTAARLAVAAAAPLSADEAYYRVWSRALAPGYFDHPPMVALWIRLGTAIAGQSAFGVRLLGPVSALLGTLLLARAARDVAGRPGAGLVAAALLNATLVVNAGSVLMTPDTPLLFFWTAALACLGRLIRTGRPAWWLGVGAAAGLALDSKYTALLLGGAIATWLLAVPSARRWLACWQLWAGGALAVAIWEPVLAWNAAHGWVSLARQGGRAADWASARAPQFVAELVGGQIGLATPGVAWVLVAGTLGVCRRFRRDPAAALLACLTVVPAGVFVLHALGGRVQANWPAVSYPGAILAAASGAARFWRPASLAGLALAMLVWLQASVAPLALPRAVDFTLIRLGGWSDLAGQVFVAALRAKAGRIVADEYGLASELAWHLPGGVIAVEPRWANFTLPAARLEGRLLLVRSVREGGGPDPRLWSHVVGVGEVVRARAGIVAETYRLYVVTWSASGTPPAAVLLPGVTRLRP